MLHPRAPQYIQHSKIQSPPSQLNSQKTRLPAPATPTPFSPAHSNKPPSFCTALQLPTKRPPADPTLLHWQETGGYCTFNILPGLTPVIADTSSWSCAAATFNCMGYVCRAPTLSLRFKVKVCKLWRGIVICVYCAWDVERRCAVE